MIIIPEDIKTNECTESVCTIQCMPYTIQIVRVCRCQATSTRFCSMLAIQTKINKRET